MRNLYLLTFILLITIACQPSQKQEGIAVSDAKNARQIGADATHFIVSTDSSYITWIGSKPAGKHYGTIAIDSGSLAMVNGEIVGGDISINLNNIVATDLLQEPERHDRLVNHLKSPDFFDVDNYPRAFFVITSVTPYDSSKLPTIKKEFESEHQPQNLRQHMVAAPTHYITGNLTLRDTTLSITFPGEIELTSQQIRASARFNIDRTKWNVKYRDEASVADRTKDRFIYNTVNVGFVLVTERKE